MVSRLLGTRDKVAEVLSRIDTEGHRFGLLLNKAKCEIYWPSGDQHFKEFPDEVIRLKDGVFVGLSYLGDTSTQKKQMGNNDPKNWVVIPVL